MSELTQAGKWEMAALTASEIVKQKPEVPSSWIAFAYATRRKQGGGLDAARKILTQAQHRFPEEPIIAYNLACYECQLGNLTQARTWLREAFKLGDARQLKQMSLQDPDLEPLRPEITQM